MLTRLAVKSGIRVSLSPRPPMSQAGREGSWRGPGRVTTSPPMFLKRHRTDATSRTHRQGIPQGPAGPPISAYPHPSSELSFPNGVTRDFSAVKCAVCLKARGIRRIFGKPSPGLAFRLCSGSPRFYRIPLHLLLPFAFQLTRPLGSQLALPWNRGSRRSAPWRSPKPLHGPAPSSLGSPSSKGSDTLFLAGLSEGHRPSSWLACWCSLVCAPADPPSPRPAAVPEASLQSQLPRSALTPHAAGPAIRSWNCPHQVGG